MTTSVVTKITIDATPKVIFGYLADLRYHKLWNPQVTHLSSQSKLKLGSTYVSTSNVLGVTIEAHNKVTSFEQDKCFQVENETGTVHYKALFELVTMHGKTKVSCTTSVSTTNKAFAFALPVMKQLARRELQTDLQALKLACEYKLES